MKQSKKILSIITASALAISCTVGASAVQTEELSSSALTKTVYGDVNHDGYVSLADAIKLMQHAIGQSKISNDNLTAAGMSSNIQLKDALEVMKIASNGKIVRVNGVKLGASSKTVNVGESFSLGASVTPSNAANKIWLIPHQIPLSLLLMQMARLQLRESAKRLLRLLRLTEGTRLRARLR